MIRVALAMCLTLFSVGCGTVHERTASFTPRSSSFHALVQKASYLQNNSDAALRGYTGCKWGEYGCNLCVEDVPKAFYNMGRSKEQRHSFGFFPDKALENQIVQTRGPSGGHVQSVQRLGGVDADNWLLVTMSADYRAVGGVYLLRFPFESHGDAWKWSTRGSALEPNAYKLMPIKNGTFSSYHPGGAQAGNGLVAISMEGDFNDFNPKRQNSAFVNFYDLRRPQSIRNTEPISRIVLDGWRRELSPTHESRASSVGWTRLSDGRYLALVGGNRSASYGWFFISNEPQIQPSTTWELADRWNYFDQPNNVDWRQWENINMVTECETGDIYAITLGTLSNRAHLYRITDRLDGRGKHRLGFALVARQSFATSGFLRAVGVSTRWGAGIHITPSRDMILYVSSRGRPYSDSGPTVITIDEFRNKRAPFKMAAQSSE